MERNIYLIGGAPTTGKSTIAEQIARHMGLPWMSTDQIREIMRCSASRSDFPNLFSPEGYNARKFLTEFSVDQIVDMEFEQAEAVWHGVKQFIHGDYTWKQGFVIEGVNIVPRLVAKDFSSEPTIKAAFLFDDDIRRIRNVIYTRGLWADADTYPDDVKEKEVEWVLQFSSRLKNEAEKFGYPCVHIHKNSADFQAVLRAYGLNGS